MQWTDRYQSVFFFQNTHAHSSVYVYKCSVRSFFILGQRQKLIWIQSPADHLSCSYPHRNMNGKLQECFLFDKKARLVYILWHLWGKPAGCDVLIGWEVINYICFLTAVQEPYRHWAELSGRGVLWAGEAHGQAGISHSCRYKHANKNIQSRDRKKRWRHAVHEVVTSIPPPNSGHLETKRSSAWHSLRPSVSESPSATHLNYSGKSPESTLMSDCGSKQSRRLVLPSSQFQSIRSIKSSLQVSRWIGNRSGNEMKKSTIFLQNDSLHLQQAADDWQLTPGSSQRTCLPATAGRSAGKCSDKPAAHYLASRATAHRQR